jgi:hypothetical protein
MLRKYNLAYYVYIENINKRKIEKYNVLNDGIINEILERTKNFKDKISFSEEVEHIIMYHYWSRSEWEIILTDWPPHMKTDELPKLNTEVEKYQKDYGREPYSLTINLSTAEKIDVYDQVMMNWNIFIDYIWENLRGE